MLKELTVAATLENIPVVTGFIDGGIPFDPLQKPDPDVTLSAEERSVGGLGILMVKKPRFRSMDSRIFTVTAWLKPKAPNQR